MKRFRCMDAQFPLAKCGTQRATQLVWLPAIGQESCPYVHMHLQSHRTTNHIYFGFPDSPPPHPPAGALTASGNMTLSCWSVRVVRAESCCAFELLSSFASAALESCKPETTAFSAFTSISRASCRARGSTHPAHHLFQLYILFGTLSVSAWPFAPAHTRDAGWAAERWS